MKDLNNVFNDVGNIQSTKRLVAIVAYLNDDFNGGYTCFDDYEIKPETGKLLVFSNSVYKHSVSKIDGGERFALSIWYNQ